MKHHHRIIQGIQIQFLSCTQRIQSRVSQIASMPIKATVTPSPSLRLSPVSRRVPQQSLPPLSDAAPSSPCRLRPGHRQLCPCVVAGSSQRVTGPIADGLSGSRLCRKTAVTMTWRWSLIWDWDNAPPRGLSKAPSSIMTSRAGATRTQISVQPGASSPVATTAVISFPAGSKGLMRPSPSPRSLLSARRPT